MGNTIETKRAEGIYARHARSCAGRPCTCDPSFRARVREHESGTRHSRTFRSFDAALNWQERVRAEIMQRRGIACASKRKAITDVAIGYASLRKTQRVLDDLVRSLHPPVRGIVREALMHLYSAEDALKEAL